MWVTGAASAPSAAVVAAAAEGKKGPPSEQDGARSAVDGALRDTSDASAATALVEVGDEE